MSGYTISASLMCADLGCIKKEIQYLEEAGVDWFHIDIMDGHFVPNFTFGPDMVRKIRKISSRSLDIHLMVENPEQYVDVWNLHKEDVLCFHIETTDHPQRIIERIKEQGGRAGVALNPATSLGSIKHILKYLDMALIMTVNPGFAGQEWVPEMVEKIKKLQAIIKEKDISLDIQVDGNIGAHNIPALKAAGANVFVGGTSSVFQNNRYLENVKEMRKFFVR